MNLVASWNPEYIKSLAARVQEMLKEEVYTEASGYVDSEGLINLHDQDETEAALSNLLANDDLLGIVESDDFPDLSWEVFQAIPTSFFEEIEKEFKEELKDAHELATNPMRFYGMSQSDFI
jgi:hypothetical protein